MNKYSVKMISRTPRSNRFEERIFMLNADGWEEAWDKAELYAAHYAQRSQDYPEEWLIVDIFHIFDEQDEGLYGYEVYSKTLGSELGLKSIRENYSWLYGE